MIFQIFSLSYLITHSNIYKADFNFFIQRQEASRLNGWRKNKNNLNKH